MGLFESFKRKNDIYDELDESEIEKREAPKSVQQPQVRKPAAPPQNPGFGALKMRLLRPTSFSEATKVADCLKAGQAVVLNLDDMDEMDARRMVDYVAGVLYAVDGKIERPAQRTFLLTPRGVSVASEDVAQLRRNN